MADSEEKDLVEIRNRQLFWSNELLIDENSKSEVIELSHDHISTVLSSSIGRWILESHLNAKSEWELSIRENADEHRHIIIDRYFEFENEHWIIDYKTSVPTSTETRRFFESSAHSIYDPAREISFRNCKSLSEFFRKHQNGAVFYRH